MDKDMQEQLHHIALKNQEQDSAMIPPLLEDDIEHSEQRYYTWFRTIFEILSDSMAVVETEGGFGIGRWLAAHILRLLECQCVCIAAIDVGTETMYPLAAIGIPTEDEQLWHDNIEGIQLQRLFDDALLIARLHGGEILSLDAESSLFTPLQLYGLVIPLLINGQLIGLLSLGYEYHEPQPDVDELILLKALARLVAVIVERENTLSERDDALVSLQEVNEQLAQANEIKREFVSVAAHEVRTTLGAIQNFSETIRDGNLSIAEMKELAVDIHADAKQLLRLINDMLDINHLQEEGIQLVLDWLDLNTVIMEAVGQVRPTTGRRPLRLQLAKALPLVKGDSELLFQVIANLLNNAIKYSPNGGEISITSQREGNVIHVTVRDHGRGIAAEEIDRIFEHYEPPFEAGATPSLPGTGMGLPTVRKIVQMHGGQLWAESILGEGSLFHFTVKFNPGALTIGGLPEK